MLGTEVGVFGAIGRGGRLGSSTLNHLEPLRDRPP